MIGLLGVVGVACGDRAPNVAIRSSFSIDDTDAIDFNRVWIVNATQALGLIQQGATVLDAQGNGLGMKRFPKAQVVQWQQFSQSELPYRGNLLEDDEALTQQLQALGISSDRPVVVFGNPPHGWGEEGRIVWMLRTLGHPKAVIVDGGIRALLAADVPQGSISAGVQGMGDFVVERSPQFTIASSDILLDTSNTTLIDTREPREYAGQTPYGEQRGGHIPGAVNLYFKDILDESGHLKSQAEILMLAEQYDFAPGTSIIAYCTGGIRSAWLTVVLTHYGFQIRNYPGSMWEWSAASPTQHPLVTP